MKPELIHDDASVIRELAEEASQKAARELFGFMDIKFPRGKNFANSPEQTVAIRIEQAILTAWKQRVERRKTALVKMLKTGREKTGRYGGAHPYGHDLLEASTIAQMKRLRNAGESFYAIAQALNVMQVPARRGKKWYGSTVERILGRQK